ncbi:MAG: hypothetical protein ACI9HK_004864, partial [Pirellulaceae bacterium]
MNVTKCPRCQGIASLNEGQLHCRTCDGEKPQSGSDRSGEPEQTAHEINARYMETKIRENKRTGFLVMLAGLCGTLVSGVLNVGFFLNGAIVAKLLGFTVICLVTFAI